MTAIDRIVAANARYAEQQPDAEPLPAPPASHLAIVTCMDARLDPLAAFGLQLGEAHVIRNAGGLVTDDVLRSLVISQRALGTAEVAVLHHTRCGMQGFDLASFRDELEQETGSAPPWVTDGFDDVTAQVRTSVARLRDCVWLPQRGAVRGFVWDVAGQAISEVDPQDG